jgi:hypothetical protein
MATPSTPSRSASYPTALFDIQKPLQFKWSDMPFFIRDYYSYMMGIVFKNDKDLMKNTDFKFYNTKNCLAFDFFTYAEDKDSYCKDLEKFDNPYQSEGACSPSFQYVRDSINIPNVISDYKLSQLSMGSVIWLYYYEKMGIFKILGALLDDYNYKGKYTIKVKDSAYAVLMEHVSILYRMGIASNLRDRVTLQEKTTGLSIDNNYGMTTTQNEGFMKTFDGILKQALEHYAYRRLDNAIGAATGAARSSVATLTTIKDSLENLKNQFQPFYYGRNAINTFLGITTVYATICLVRLMKSDIGIPNQYEKPQEFLPAAYDILVMGKPAVNTDSNRFIIYDNCASYGYRLLTDFEFVNTSLFNPSSNVDDPLNLWINNIEPLVEGYKKAVGSIKD